MYKIARFIHSKLKEPWQMTREEWNRHNFDENVHIGLPSDYFSGHGFDAKKSVTTLVSTLPPGIEIRKDKYGIVYAFDGEKNVGMGDGKAFVVSKEYQNKGIGTAMLKLTYKGRPIGSRTQAGQQLIESFHKKEVLEALRRGKPVPAKVLADYPKLNTI